MMENNLESAADTLKLYPYEEVFQHSRVIKDSLFPDTLLVKVPEKLLSTPAQFFNIYELNNRDDKKLDGKVSRDNRTWIAIKSSGLNLSIGQHIYVAEFLLNDSVLKYFFIYNIQSDNPDKPYNYMDIYRKKG